MSDLVALQQALGVSFNNQAYLEQALIHSSYINENPDLTPTSNERLEFLGDAVLGMIVAKKLYQEFSNLTEGEMTKLRAALVRQDTLARIARSINVGDYLYLGKGEEASGGRHKSANLAGALEAVIAAVFLDQGLATTKEFVLRLFEQELQKVVSEDAAIDYKSRLQEIIQAKEQQTPVYHVIEATGPDHNKRFTVEVRLGDHVLGRGSGRSKKTAETEAARAALQQIDFTR